MLSQEGERITDDRFESGSADRSVRRCDDAFEVSAVSGVWRQEGGSGIYHISVRSSSVCDHGNAVVGLHVWKRNTLLSIAVGTVFYMFLVQVVF